MSAADDLRALSAAATPGPWRLNDSEHYRAPQVLMAPGEGGVRISGLRDSADAALIVWCRNHADALTDLIEWANDAPHHDGCNARHNGSPQPAAARPYPCKCGRYAALAALEADRG